MLSHSVVPKSLQPHGLQARILEWVAISSSRGSSELRDQNRSPALQVDSVSSEPPGEPNIRPTNADGNHQA